MDKEEVAMIGFQIVAYSGEARSKYIEAIRNLKEGGSKEKTLQLISEGDEKLTKAHNTQTELLSREADGEEIELGFIFVHGQDHLMTTVLLKDMLDFIMDIYK
ncbi:PTS lactose/cellobiose transporter subunit IIA [Atopobacter sp. AH10]|uniref:PTS lactose/cellobiose transporter subunit IIA n=1 Tax=Atopobacter sp. AH10 TaxID=2315861 RepID=UPI000EF2476C|nr:PTS lactose/cellobiose transporter subunit IIA [Atopobacter sp. AH10]RLK63451.1 PTS lactose/cellobiose transporter subunit IIA [Atopobacter sp. AH10]